MGWSIRKSFRFGPVRVNLSNRGISSSFGVKGARVSFSKRGTFLNLGLKGIYYRKKINLTDMPLNFASQLQSTARKKNLIVWLAILPSLAAISALLIYLGKPLEINKVYTAWVNVSKNSVRVRSAPSIDGMIIGTANHTDRFRLIERTENGWFKLWYDDSTIGYVNQDLGFVEPVLSSPEVIRPLQSYPALRVTVVTTTSVLLIAYCIWFSIYDKKRRTLIHNYQVDENLKSLHEKFLASFSELSNSNKIWSTVDSVWTSEKKYNAGANQLISRSEIVSISDNKPIPFLKTNIKIPRIELQNISLYFFPDQLILRRHGWFSGIAYKNLTISIKDVQFVESDDLPSDATVIDYTWKYLNKNGDPDLRFTGNRQLPVCRYTEYHFQSGNELNEVITTSKMGAMNNLASFLLVISNYQKKMVTEL